MSDTIKNLRFCAYCPNPCRSAVDEADPYPESETPSALSLLAVLVADGNVAWDAAINDALSRDRVAIRCADRCPYPFDIPAELKTFRNSRQGGENV
jgi:hypothetical protein